MTLEANRILAEESILRNLPQDAENPKEFCKKDSCILGD